MTTKQNYSSGKKAGEITRSERTFASQQTASVLKNIKEKKGKVIHVAISPRTTIELPAHLSQSEIDARIEKHIRLRKSNV